MATSTSTQVKNSSTKGKTAREGGEHILVIRFSAMGDVAILAPVLRAITSTYPNLKITVLTRGFFAPIFRDIPNVEVYKADLKGIHSGVRGLCRLASELRELGINAVADVHDVLRSNVLRSIFYFFGIPVKQIDKGRDEKKALTAAKNKVFIQLKTTSQRYADVFAQLGYPVDLNNPKIAVKQKLSPKIVEFTGKDLKKWVGIAPFAQHNSKVYPLDLMDKVVQDLNEVSSLKIFLFGGGEEEISQLKTLASKYENVNSTAGKFTFEEELALISNLDVMLSMDSGNAHLAALFGIPVITLWGVTHPYAGFPAFGQPEENNLLPDLKKYPLIPTSVYGDKVPQGYEDVMRTIPPGKVVERILEVLKIPFREL